MQAEAKLTKEEFCARFKAHMLTFRDKFDDGSSVADYADETAPTYFDGQYQEGDESPEEWAEADVSYWED